VDRYYVVNTNDTYLDGQEKMMFRQNCIFARYGPKDKIDIIEEGDIVFLYKNQVGIITYGIADGDLAIGDYKGHKDEEHLMHVDRFRILKTPITPSEITALSKRLALPRVFYARTVSPLRPELGDALLNLFE